MAKEKYDKNIKVHFIGNNADDVTGSCIYIETKHYKILLECGMIQSNDIIESYNINNQRFNFNACEIDYCFLLHSHIDHSGLIPKLIKDGFKGTILSTYNSKELSKPLLYDSEIVASNNALRISKRKEKNVSPLYEKANVDSCFDNWNTCEYNKIITLNDEISFELLYNSHTIDACQLLLYIKDGLGRTKTILYTSDLGSEKFKQYYVNKTKYVSKCDLAIVESTYGLRSNICTKDLRNKELKQLKESIQMTCDIKKGRVLIPSFAFGRTQLIATILYDLFVNDSTFKYDIVIDGVLAYNINNVYSNILKGNDLEKWKSVLAWNRLKVITNYEDSIALQMDKTPKIIISSSGFLNGGRILQHLKTILQNTNDLIIFAGYSSPDSLAGQIKSRQKEVKVDGIKYKNRCDILTLNSFSSHIQRQEMLNYYSKLNTNKIILVHGEEQAKEELKEDLIKELRLKLKTTNVIKSYKGLKINL